MDIKTEKDIVVTQVIDVCSATLKSLCIHMIHNAQSGLPIFGQELLICSMFVLQSVGHSRTVLNNVCKPSHKDHPKTCL